MDDCIIFYSILCVLSVSELTTTLLSSSIVIFDYALKAKIKSQVYFLK